MKALEWNSGHFMFAMLKRKFLGKEKTQVLSVYNILLSFAFVAEGLSMGIF